MKTLIFRFTLVCAISLVWSKATDYEPDHFQLRVDNIIVNGSTVSVIEGDNLQLECVFLSQHNSPSASVVWREYDHIFGDPDLANSTLEIQNIQKNHDGKYICAVEPFYSSFTINVLYPPDNLKVDGPEADNAPFKLNCSSESNPPATYYWLNDTLSHAEKISTGSIITVDHVNPNGIILYCIALNIMVPTIGEPVQGFVVSDKRQVGVQDKKSPVDCQSNNGGLIAAVVIGWIIGIIAVVVTAVLYSKKRASGQGRAENYNRFVGAKFLGNASGAKIATPTAPIATINLQALDASEKAKESEDRKSVHSYLDLEASGDGEGEDLYEQVENNDQYVTAEQEKQSECNSVQKNLSLYVSSDGYEIPKET